MTGGAEWLRLATGCGSSSSPATRRGRCSASCSREMGADVVKVEPPEGSPSRAVGPFVGDRVDPDHSLTFWYYNTNKRSVVVDYRTAAGRERLLQLASDADVYITTLRPPDAARARPRARGGARRERPPRRGLDHAVRPRRAVGGSAQLRPGRPRARQPSEQLRLRRPHDPADPSGRRSGVPVGVQLRAHGAAARPGRSAADREGAARRRRHARLPRGERRARQPLLVLPEGRRAPADLPSRAADTHRAGAVPLRRRPVRVLRAVRGRPQALAGARRLDGHARAWPRTCSSRSSSDARLPAGELRPHPGAGRGLLPPPDRGRGVPRRPGSWAADRDHLRARRPVPRRALGRRGTSSSPSSTTTCRRRTTRARRSGSPGSRAAPVQRAPRLGEHTAECSRRRRSPEGSSDGGEAFSHRDRCAIVGIGATDFSRELGAQRSDPRHAGGAGRDRRCRPRSAGHRRHRPLRHGPRSAERPRRVARAEGPHLLGRGRARRHGAVRDGRAGGRARSSPGRPRRCSCSAR